MTGGELINLLWEEIDGEGLADTEIVAADIFDLLKRIDIPADYYTRGSLVQQPRSRLSH